MVRLGGGSDIQVRGCRVLSCRPPGVVWSCCDGGEVADGNSLVVVRAGPAGSDTAAEDSAVVAALPAEVAGLAGRALIHGVVSGRQCGGQPGSHGLRAGGAAAPAGLAAGIGAPAAPSGGGERLAAGRAPGGRIVTAVVTRRHRWLRRLG